MNVAWLTTQDRATLKSEMSVKAASNITVDVNKVGFVANASLATGKGNVTDSNIEMGTVSSFDGLHFYAPKALVAGLDGAGNPIAAPYASSEFGEVTDSEHWTETNKYVGYLKYYITVHAPQEEENNRHQLYYKISFSSTATNVVNAYRVALYETNSKWEGTDNTLTKKGMWANAVDNDTKAMKDTTYANAATPSGVAALGTAFANPVGTTYTTASALTKYYIFSVWIEGQDADAINYASATSIAGEAFSTSIEFSLGALAA